MRFYNQPSVKVYYCDKTGFKEKLEYSKLIKSKEFLLFGLVGCAGFVVDSGVLYALKGTFGIYIARAFSFILAVLTTWFLNKIITFNGSVSNKPVLNELLRYFLFMISGGTINYLVYWVLTKNSELVYSHPVIGVAAGSLAGMVLNYLTSKYLVFNKKMPT